MNTLVFGASGSLGSYIHTRALEKGPVTPTSSSHAKKMVYFNHNLKDTYANLANQPKFDAVIWAQGCNVNDSVGAMKGFMYVMDANVAFVVRSLDWLVENDRLNEGARLCVISSIWQDIARQNKFSYSISKAALGGLVRSAAADLGPKNIYINAVLPGPIDNSMTRNNLTREQLDSLPGLVRPEDVWNAIDLLCFKQSCMNGQSVILDHGFSVTRNL